MSVDTQDNVLDVRDVTIELNARGRRATPVSGLSFAVRRGSKLAIVGESGCGKSITALAVMRLLQHPLSLASGEIWLDGVDVVKLTEREMTRVRGRSVGMIYQDPMSSLNPVKTIGAQLVEAITTAGVARGREAQSRAVELLDDVGVTKARQRLGSYPHEFSGGMRQRVMIAMAMSARPSVILADEPTTALDVTTQARVLALLQRMTDEQGTSVVLITHDMGVASSFCDDVQVMYAGQIVERGATGAVLRSARHHYTSALVRAVPRLDDPVDEPLRTVSGQPPLPGSFGEACRFADRCPAVRDLCRAVEPQLEMRSGHGVRCHFPVSDGAIVNAVAGVR